MRGKFSFQFNRLPSTLNVRQLSGGKWEVIVHTDISAHKYNDDQSKFCVAFMKGLQADSVIVKALFGQSD